MPWDENRRLKITLLREKPQGQNVVIEFEVAEHQRINFQKSLEYFLAACINVEGTIKSFLEITDAETGVISAMEIQIIGSHEKLITELNKSMPDLKAYSMKFR